MQCHCKTAVVFYARGVEFNGCLKSGTYIPMLRIEGLATKSNRGTGRTYDEQLFTLQTLSILISNFHIIRLKKISPITVNQVVFYTSPVEQLESNY